MHLDDGEAKQGKSQDQGRRKKAKRQQKTGPFSKFLFPQEAGFKELDTPDLPASKNLSRGEEHSVMKTEEKEQACGSVSERNHPKKKKHHGKKQSKLAWSLGFGFFVSFSLPPFRTPRLFLVVNAPFFIGKGLYSFVEFLVQNTPHLRAVGLRTGQFVMVDHLLFFRKSVHFPCFRTIHDPADLLERKFFVFSRGQLKTQLIGSTCFFRFAF